MSHTFLLHRSKHCINITTSLCKRMINLLKCFFSSVYIFSGRTADSFIILLLFIATVNTSNEYLRLNSIHVQEKCKMESSELNYVENCTENYFNIFYMRLLNDVYTNVIFIIITSGMEFSLSIVTCYGQNFVFCTTLRQILRPTRPSHQWTSGNTFPRVKQSQ